MYARTYVGMYVCMYMCVYIHGLTDACIRPSHAAPKTWQSSSKPSSNWDAGSRESNSPAPACRNTEQVWEFPVGVLIIRSLLFYDIRVPIVGNSRIELRV